MAVISVVGYHAFPEWVKGGFIGVDIFFVISGYLISTIIMRKLQRNAFSFSEFYARRIRRIFPALLTVLAACLSLGWFVLFFDEYMQLGKHVLAGAGFVSNLVLWRESNYFDNAAYTKPLLHLWSLGVEEQFYIVWPLLLWIAWKLRANLAILMIAIIAASFILNIHWSGSDHAAAFYSPATRFWELMVGSLLAYWKVNEEQFIPILSERYRAYAELLSVKCTIAAHGATWRNIASLTGASLIAIGIGTVTRATAFPGWWAVLPTLGAALLISAGPHAWLNRVLLSSPVAVSIGLISFPLYLWHWPLISFARIVESQMPGVWMRAAAMAISVALASCTFQLIEKPLRSGERLHSKTLGLMVLMGMTGLIGYQVHQQHGVDFRHVTTFDLRNGFEGADDGVAVGGCGIKDDARKLFAVCAHDPRKTERYALLGDSKAAAIFGGLVRTSTERGRWLFVGGNNGNGAPVPVLSDNKIYAQYQKMTSIALDAISSNNNIETVVLAAATSNLFALEGDTSIEELPKSQYYATALEGLDNAVSQLIASGKQVVLLVDNPTLPDPHDCMERKIATGWLGVVLATKRNPACGMTIGRHLELSAKYRMLLKEVASRHPLQVTVFDTLKYMCDVAEGVCLPYKNGRMLYSYTYHISDYAAGMIGRDLNLYLDNH